MKDINNVQCNHKYIIGYSFRMPQLFFRDLPCDYCKCSIRLSLPWRIVYYFVSIVGYIIAFDVSMSVHIKFLGSTFIVSIFVATLLIWIVQLMIRFIFRYGRWVKIDNK